MADEKMSSWSALTGANADRAADYLPIIDASVADASKNKTITLTELSRAIGWSLFSSWTYSSDVAQVDFTGLANYSDVLVITRGITKSVTGLTCIRLSVDNGSNYLAGASDYAVISVAGGEATGGQLALHGTNATAARSGIATISGINVNGAVKYIDCTNQAAGSIACLFLGSTSPVTALRIFPNGGGNFTGGTILVYAR